MDKIIPIIALMEAKGIYTGITPSFQTIKHNILLGDTKEYLSSNN